MEKKLSILLIAFLIVFQGFAQNDPMANIKKSKEEKAKDEQKLNEKGKSEYAKAQAEFKKQKDATYEVSANEILNEDLKNLVGLPAGERPDEKLAEAQNAENKKNQKELAAKLKKDSKNDKADLETSGTPPSGVGASWTDTQYWIPSFYTPIKNQGSCGSCWSFAACATFEHTYAKFYGTKLDLSEQDIVACGVTCGGVDCGSCGGGWSDRAFDFIKCKGVASETSYAYTATSTPCYNKPKFKTANSWGRLLVSGTYPSVDWIKYYITLYGSVVTYMKAGVSTFYSYGGGVYNGYPSSNPNDIDHAVTIVGWWDAGNAWIIKNSWGTGWGPYGGYAYVHYNACNIGKWIYWVYPNQ